MATDKPGEQNALGSTAQSAKDAPQRKARKPKKRIEPKRTRGGQTTYTRAKADAIIERLEEGVMLRAICKELSLSVRTIMHWCEDDRDGFAARYARARLACWDCVAEEAVWIADNEPDPQRARVMVDTRKWLLSKLHPDKYGDKIGVGVDGLTGFLTALRDVGQVMLQKREDSASAQHLTVEHEPAPPAAERSPTHKQLCVITPDLDADK